jgi:hypothetical protein
MLPNDDLARWGEPPTDEREMALADLLAAVLRSDRTAETLTSLPHPDLAEVCRRIDEMMATVADGSGVLENLPPPADAGGLPGGVALRLRVSRLVSGVWQTVASTAARPCVVRDMRRVPADADRVVLRTGERVRVEVECDRAGHLLVFNVGPRGAVHVLFPEREGEAGRVRERETVPIAQVVMAPPAGRERLYAVWSRPPLAAPAAQLRDMKRVEDRLDGLRPEDWHAVLLELDHAP